MKRFYLCALALCCAFLLSFAPAVGAFNYSDYDMETLTESADFDEISQMEEEMLENIVELYTSEYGQEPSDIPEHIDYSNAVKIYIDTDVLALNTDDAETILNALTAGDYVWVIETTIDDVAAEVTLARGEPLNEERTASLTEEERESIRQQEGKWGITATGITPKGETKKASYVQKLTTIFENNEDTLSDVEQIAIAGGIPAFRYPIAIAFDGEKATQWLSFGEDFITAYLEEGEIAEVSDASTRSALRAGLSSDVYDFDLLADYARDRYEEPASGYSGGTGGAADGVGYEIGVGVVLVLALGVCIFVVLRKRFS